ncbi:MAG: NUDIX hydrolase [Chloroflexales bacterium]|nr:NUDIX hydrolase [Chloroflexales bacterium]
MTTPTYSVPIDEAIVTRITRDGRIGEVCMILRRPDGHLWCAAKAYYPAHIARLLTGGIQPDEDPVAALYREIAEETGLQPRHHRLIFTITYRGVNPFITYAYLCDVSDDDPQSHDPAEQINHFEAITATQLPQRATELRALPAINHPEIGGTWQAWGEFRAHCHDYLGAYLNDISAPREPGSPL